MIQDGAIRGCFGDKDFIFAGHPLDEERAYRLLGELRGGRQKG